MPLLTLQEQLQQLCYERVMPHLEMYNAEPDLEKCLPLMEPQIIADFAVEAGHAVARRILNAAHNSYSQHSFCQSLISGDAQSGGIAEMDQKALYEVLWAPLMAFSQALDRYAREFDRVKQMCSQATGAVVSRSCTVGRRAGQMAEGFGGWVVAVATTIAGSVLATRGTIKELNAAGRQLQQAFGQLGEAYDQAMAKLIAAGIKALGAYRKRLAKAAGN
jgi:hypothetical protein